MVTLPPSFLVRSASAPQLGNCECAQRSAIFEPQPVAPVPADPSDAWADAFTVASVLTTVNNLLGGFHVPR